jgi:hypothetical protein
MLRKYSFASNGGQFENIKVILAFEHALISLEFVLLSSKYRNLRVCGRDVACTLSHSDVDSVTIFGMVPASDNRGLKSFGEHITFPMPIKDEVPRICAKPGGIVGRLLVEEMARKRPRC